MQNKRKNLFIIKAIKLAKKKTTKFVIGCMLFMSFIFFLLFTSIKDILNYKIIFIFFITLIIVIGLLLIFCSRKYKESIFSEEYNKLFKDYSKFIVEIMFILGKPLEVEPIKAKNPTYKDIVLEAKENKPKFYGILLRDNIIHIYIKSPNDRRIIDVDNVSKEDFTTYYKLLDFGIVDLINF